jgi:peptidoglycan/LPS O-acetylase OafA/YrhL
MRRLVALDSLRGVCAVFVVLLHINALSHFADWTVVRQAGLFVDFFFVLSGFVIAYAYLDRIGDLRAGAVFLIRRIGRVWPLHAVVLALMVGSELVKFVLAQRGLPVHEAPFTGRYAPDALLASLALVHSLGLYPSEVWNGPSWSISVEFWTYVAFAAVALLARRIVLRTSAALILLGIAVLVMSGRYLDTSMQLGIFRCIYGFFAGVLAERLYRAALRDRRAPPLASWLEAAAILAVYGLVAVCAVAPKLAMLVPPLFAVVVLTFAFERGRIAALLTTRPFVWVGDRSYAIYIVHALLIEQLNRVLLITDHLTGAHFIVPTTMPGEMGDAISVHGPYVTDLVVLAYVGAVLLFAHLAHVTVEARGRAVFARLARRVQPPVHAPTR